MPVEVMLHQAVFGYDAGHNLLAASCTLSAESRRTLAVLTDAPGPWPTSGFDLIFTGTPLPDMPYYALFCTWPAPEMPRPGCVWSHVILIELADLAGLADLGELCHCFRRPSKTVDQKWRDPLHFVVKRDIAAPIARGLQRDCQRFLAALYAKPQLPFVAEALNAETYADLVFALWSQQWPRLRRNFRFSTGSFADRGRVGAAFDLQVTPTSSRRAWQRSDGHLLSEGVDSPTEELPADSEQWIRIALDDLLAPSKTGFRSFLCAYGTDVNHPRGAFARLATAYHRLSAQPCGDWTE